MNTNTVLRFLGWAFLTWLWLEANCMSFNAIADAIHQHNEEIRQKAIDVARELLKQNDDSESEAESEVVVETVTKTVTETVTENE